MILKRTVACVVSTLDAMMLLQATKVCADMGTTFGTYKCEIFEFHIFGVTYHM